MKRKAQVRAGFTLIELLVVIAIIAILVALTTAAVYRYFQKIPEIKTRNDIAQLATSLEPFRGKYNFSPPTPLYRANTPANYSGNSVSALLAFPQASLKYIRPIWPRID